MDEQRQRSVPQEPEQAESIDIEELTAAVERLLRRDLEIERERQRAGQPARRW